MQRKDRIKGVCILLLLLSVLWGCGREDRAAEAQEETVTLWVVTEVTPLDGMNYQAEEAVKRFREAHENVTVNLEILPTDQEERAIRLKQLRAMIPAGRGPDIYLLPVDDTLLLTDPKPYTPAKVEALFSDVTLAMYNGDFADISAYYDGDETLGKEALNTAVMDAGVIDGARYVLPLRYDLPLIYSDPRRWADWGLDQETFDAGIGALMEVGLDRQTPDLFACGLPLSDDLRLLPQVFDYENGELLLTKEELTDYMKLYQRWKAVTAQNPNLLSPRDYRESRENYISGWNRDPGVLWEDSQNGRRYNSIRNYIQGFLYWYREGFPLYSGSLGDAVSASAVARMRGYDMSVLPLRTMDGSLAAEVTYYGAVGSGCRRQDLAYEFLRIFLTEEFQWDGCRPRAKKSPTGSEKEPQRPGMVEDSWPVRTAGSAAAVWENIQYQYLYYVEDALLAAQTARCRLVQTFTMTEEDIPALGFEIDEVRFPIVQDAENSISYALALLNDEKGNPTDADLEALAEEVLLELWWHLAEG